ncbi:MAG: hypothetical protein GY720_01680 [bacterium]|nr:hypothetical protein [bacterium]
MKFTDTDTRRTAEDISDVIQWLVKHAPDAKIKAEHGAPGIRNAFRELATSAKCLERGELITRIAQLPPSKAPVLMEYLIGDGPWRGDDPRAFITLRNNGSEDVMVVTSEVRNHHINPETGKDKPDAWDTEFFEDRVAPGETIEVRPHYAFIALYDRCKRAWHPSHWNSWKGVEDTIEEVGFRCTLPMLDKDNPEREITAPIKPKRRKAKPATEAQLGM